MEKHVPDLPDPRSAVPSAGRGRRRAFSLVELLIVIAMLGVMAGLAVSRFEPGLHDGLRSAAEVLAADMAYARSLAVANNSTYRIEFSIPDDVYWLEHTGTNAALNTLPPSPFRDSRDPPTRNTTFLRNLPGSNGAVELIAVRKVTGGTEEDVTRIEFDPLGSLTQSEDAIVWLAIGVTDARRYVSVRVDPVTGIAFISDLEVAGPRLSGVSSGNGPAGVPASGS